MQDTMISTTASQLLSQLRYRRVAISDFRLCDLSPEDVKVVLEEAYRQEVITRHNTFEGNAVLSETISCIATWLTQPQRERKQCLFIAGIPGTGKTTILMAIRNLLNLLHKKDPICPSTTISELFLNIKTSKEIASIYSEDKRSFREIANTFFLGIDDFGNEPNIVLNHGNVFSPLQVLLEQRYITQYPTIITTNLNGKDIRKRYGDRIADRLSEMALPVSIKYGKVLVDGKFLEFSYRNKQYSQNCE